MKIIATIIALAISLTGTPYHYSSAGPSSFDCSGFTRYCYADYVELPHSAKEQGYSDYPTIETIEELKEGDLVCFNTVADKDLSDHVGIYLGNREFIHCSSAKGKVIISRLDEGHYNTVFSWGKRIIGGD